MSKVEVDGESKYLMLVFQDGHRSTVSLEHKDGLELLAQLQAYYKDGSIRRNVIRSMARAMLEELTDDKAAAALGQLLDQQGEVPSGDKPKGQ